MFLCFLSHHNINLILSFSYKNGPFSILTAKHLLSNEKTWYRELLCIYRTMKLWPFTSKDLVYSFCKEQEKKVLRAFDKNPGYVSNPHTLSCRYVQLRPIISLKIWYTGVLYKASLNPLLWILPALPSPPNNCFL